MHWTVFYNAPLLYSQVRARTGTKAMVITTGTRGMVTRVMATADSKATEDTAVMATTTTRLDTTAMGVATTTVSANQPKR